ncbi:hypothetical protein ASPZODRAFT_137230 [Penicilliopsis zonata CBS 506.65]|uniref:Lipase n=1 Tax=Penicilliopsis zonata CBS 506.65 TaxID=1073090 RepID=A0A1L9S649_9EURO|nr:hypothetical protein ASPZODRAFT_137230 [Penicilliopsis zonata CBS 506.65]OJJ42620.1 hypothetical protein ASPZODRAFT_137230 [Penicilliopsis zonata CBS 506.65]
MVNTLLLASLLAAPLAAATVLPPTEDPWYTAPEGYESATPGTVLRIRSAPGNLTEIVGNSSAAYNILFRTTDSLYGASWAVTTVFVPEEEDCENPSLLSYQIPYDSLDVNDSPSYALYSDPPADVGVTLGLGWWVSVPDFEGPLASFTAGVMSGHATLDSVRAVLRAQIGLEANGTQKALWGYSGGALASEWAAELQPQYAPELKLAGIAVGGLTPNTTSVMDSVDGTIAAGLIPAAVLGVLTQYPVAEEWVISQLHTTGEYNRTGFLATKDLSLDEAEVYYAYQDIFEYFVNGSSTFQNEQVVKVLMRDGYMGFHGIPEMPVYAYKAINDEISPVADTDDLINRYCAAGANIIYERNTVGGHDAEEVNGNARALAWLQALLSGGSYDHAGCTISNVTIAIEDSPY